MTVIRHFVVSFSILALTAAYAQTNKAQGQQQGQASPQQGAQSQQQGQIPAQQLIGQKVTDAQGEDLGKISDVVVDLQSGQVHAGVLEFGGTLGVGGKNYAFPIQDLEPGKSQGQYTLANVEKQKLEKSQGYAQGVWPEIDPQYWGREGQGGQAAAGGTQAPQKGNLVRASKINGKKVSDKSGQEVGELRDLTIDLQSGKVQDVVLNVKDGGQTKVQPQALSAGAGDKLVLAMDAQQVKQQSGQKQQGQKQQQGNAAASQPSSESSAAGASQPAPKQSQ